MDDSIDLVTFEDEICFCGNKIIVNDFRKDGDRVIEIVDQALDVYQFWESFDEPI